REGGATAAAAVGAVDVLAGAIAAAVDAAAGPDTHHVALANASLDRQTQLGPPLLAHNGLQQVLRDIVGEHPALHLGCVCGQIGHQRSEQGERSNPHGCQKTSFTGRPFSTIFTGRPTSLSFSFRGSMSRAEQKVQNRSGTVTGRSTTSMPLGSVAPMTRPPC